MSILDTLIGPSTASAPYDPDELQRYLTQSRMGAGYTPSFSNIPEQIEEGQGKVFGVGVRKTPAGKWEKVQAVDEGMKPISPAARAKKNIPETGMPAVDSLARLQLEKAEFEQLRDAQLAQAASASSPEIEKLTASLEVLGRATQIPGARGDKYKEQYNQTVSILQNARAAQDAARKDAMLDPKFQSLEAGIKQKEIEIASMQKRADHEWDVRKATEMTTARLTTADTAAREAAIKDVPEATGIAYQKIAGSVDVANAKAEWVTEQDALPDSLKIVVQDVAQNINSPQLATPIMNMDKPADQLDWYLRGYMNSGDRTDIVALQTKDVLASEIRNMHTGMQKDLQKEYENDDTLKALQGDIAVASGGTNATREALGYDAKLMQQKAVKQQIAADYMQSVAATKLKNTLLDTNTDLISLPSNLTSRQSFIGQKLIDTVRLPQFTSLQEAVDYFYRVEMPALVETGETRNSVIVAAQAVLESYMNNTNKRHYASGVTIGPADIPSPATVFISTAATAREPFASKGTTAFPTMPSMPLSAGPRGDALARSAALKIQEIAPELAARVQATGEQIKSIDVKQEIQRLQQLVDTYMPMQGMPPFAQKGTGGYRSEPDFSVADVERKIRQLQALLNTGQPTPNFPNQLAP